MLPGCPRRAVEQIGGPRLSNKRTSLPLLSGLLSKSERARRQQRNPDHLTDQPTGPAVPAATCSAAPTLWDGRAAVSIRSRAYADAPAALTRLSSVNTPSDLLLVHPCRESRTAGANLVLTASRCPTSCKSFCPFTTIRAASSHRTFTVRCVQSWPSVSEGSPRTPEHRLKGCGDTGDEVKRDDIVVLEVMVPVLDRGWWHDYRSSWNSYFVKTRSWSAPRPMRLSKEIELRQNG